MIQGSPEWFAARCGKVTASRVSDIIAKTKTGVSALRGNYAAELIAERLTGTTAPSFASPAMQHGTLCEPMARCAYAARMNAEVLEVAFVDHPEIANAGASPDGLVEADGQVEIKCPNTATHLDTLLGASIDGKYITQMQWQMACTGRAWCDYVSFDPRLPPNMQLHIQRVPRDVGMILDLEQAVTDFLAEIDAKVKALGARYPMEAAA
jgi:putative phage-type endonuclease